MSKIHLKLPPLAAFGNGTLGVCSPDRHGLPGGWEGSGHSLHAQGSSPECPGMEHRLGSARSAPGPRALCSRTEPELSRESSTAQTPQGWLLVLIKGSLSALALLPSQLCPPVLQYPSSLPPRLSREWHSSCSRQGGELRAAGREEQ